MALFQHAGYLHPGLIRKWCHSVWQEYLETDWIPSATAHYISVYDKTVMGCRKPINRSEKALELNCSTHVFPGVYENIGNLGAEKGIADYKGIVIFHVCTGRQNQGGCEY